MTFVAQAIVLALLFFLPYVVLPIGVTPFETPKVFIAELLIAALVIVCVTTMPLKKLVRKNIFPLLLFLLFLFSLFHLFLHPTSISFFGNQFRMQGVFLLWLLLALAFVSTEARLKKMPVWTITLFLTVHLLAAIFITTTRDGRAVGTLGEPNALAAVAIFLWPFLWKSRKESRVSAVLQIVSMLLVVSLIYISGSRSAMTAFVIQNIFLLLGFSRFLALGKAVIIVLLLFAATLFLPAVIERQTVYENRVEIWQTALLAGYERPFVGWGFGNTEVALKEYNQKLYTRLRGYYVDSSHNVFLDFWVQGGFIGLSSLVVLIYCAFRIYTRQKDIIKLCLLLGLLAVMSFNPVSVVTSVQFWWLIGQVSKT